MSQKTAIAVVLKYHWNHAPGQWLASLENVHMAVTECRSFTTKTKEKQTEIAYPILRYSSNVCRIKSPLVTTESTTESPVNMWFNNSDTVSCLEHTQTHKHATSRSPSPDKTHSGAWETILMGHLMGCCLKTPPYHLGFRELLADIMCAT